MGFGKGRNVMKQYIVAMQIVICTLFIFGGCGNDEKIEYPYTQEYEVGQGNIKGNVDIASFIAITATIIPSKDIDIANVVN